MAEETGETVGNGIAPSLAHSWVPAFAEVTEKGVGRSGCPRKAVALISSGDY